MEKGEIVPIHFIWECEGLEDQDYVNGWKNPHGISHVMKWLLFHDLPSLHQIHFK
jgi:hypothetical protein